MAEDIGYNDGIQSFETWVRNLAVAIDKHNVWVNAFVSWSIGPRSTPPPTPPKLPRIPLEGINYVEADKNSWPWPNKFFRNTMRKLKDHHDAVNPSNPPNGGNGDPIPTPVKIIAPRTFNKVLPNGSDARFCITGLPRHTSGENAGLPYDDFTTYDNNGLDKGGGRDKDYQVDGLRQANSMDQYGPCDLYPPLTAWPGNLQDETGSYHR